VFLPDDSQIEMSVTPVQSTNEPMSPPTQEINQKGRKTEVDSDTESESEIIYDSPDTSDEEVDQTIIGPTFFDRFKCIDDIRTRVKKPTDIFALPVWEVKKKKEQNELLNHCLQITRTEGFRENPEMFIKEWKYLLENPYNPKRRLIRFYKKEILATLKFSPNLLKTMKEADGDLYFYERLLMDILKKSSRTLFAETKAILITPLHKIKIEGMKRKRETSENRSIKRTKTISHVNLEEDS
jgi:hypothetical protein